MGLPISRTVLPADAQAAMQYLFRGVLPLTMPPLPTVEIRDGSSRSVSDLLAKEVCAGTLQTAGVSKSGHLHVPEAPPMIVSVIIVHIYRQSYE